MISVEGSGAASSAVKSEGEARSKESLTEKQLLISIDVQLRLMNAYLSEMTGLQIDIEDLEQIK